MAIIKVSPELLRQNANRMNEIKAKNNDLSKRINQTSTLLDNSWDGTASVQMVQKFQEINSQIKSMDSSYSDAVYLLQQYASSFEKVGLNKNQIIGWTIRPVTIIPDVFVKVLGCNSNPFIQPKSADIRVVPAGLRESASSAKSASNIVKEIITCIDKVRNELQNCWQGNASQKFVNNLENYRIAYKNLAYSLEEYAQEITMAVNDYERIDNM